LENKKYDFLIVGSGLFGAIFAHEMTKLGFSCLVIDKRPNIGGNIFCEEIEGINVHKYGPHIFHTNDKHIWDYVNQFTEFNHFRYSPIARYKDEQFNLPFNMNTFYQLWKTKTPEDAKRKLQQQIDRTKIQNPSNLEEQALNMCGEEIYEKLIRGYTEKQWGRSAKELPTSMIKRLPFRLTYDNNYFNDTYQGIPIGGYNRLINGLLKNIDVKINVDYLRDRYELNNVARRVLYTGAIDAFFDYKFGNLEYRSLRFKHESLPIENFQGVAVVNYTDSETSFTRIIEHKHFEFGRQRNTVITYEYPQKYEGSLNEPYYPVNNTTNNELYKKYRSLALENDVFLFGGRLAEYKYYDMHQIIASALSMVKSIISFDET
jgi:UDP-galactopyranose mutase